MITRYYDVYAMNYYTMPELLDFFTTHKDEIQDDSGADTFAGYLSNCIDSGTLEPVEDWTAFEIDCYMSDYEYLFYGTFTDLEDFRRGTYGYIPTATKKSIDAYIDSHADEIIAELINVE